MRIINNMIIIIMQTTTSGKGSKNEDKILIQSDNHSDEAYFKNMEFKKALTVVERMANQNTFDEVAEDFKYWEDLSDKMASKKGLVS